MKPEDDHFGRDELDRYLLGELELGAVRRIEEHLATCSACQATLEAVVRRDAELSTAGAAWSHRDGAAARSRRTALAFGVAALAAAAAVLIATRPTEELRGLPAYAVSIAAGDQPLRGEARSTETTVLSPGSRLQVRLEPEREVEGAQHRLFDAFEGGVHELVARVEVVGGGVARISVEVAPGSSLAEAGTHTLLVVVGPSGATLDPAELLPVSDHLGPWQVHAAPVRVLPPSPSP